MLFYIGTAFFIEHIIPKENKKIIFIFDCNLGLDFNTNIFSFIKVCKIIVI